MPYYHIEILHNKTTQFIVTAPNKESAEDIALIAEAGGAKLDAKKIVKRREGGSHTISIDEGNKTDWAEALKQQKASK